jgi:hypothetical protein
MTDENFLLSHEELAEQQAERSRQEQQRAIERDDLKWVMSNVKGRRFMWRLLGQTGLYKTSYRPDRQPHDVLFMEGQRNIGLTLLGELDSTCPERYAEMMEERGK